MGNNKTKKCRDSDSVIFYNYDDPGSYYDFSVSKKGIGRGMAIALTAKEAQRVVEQHEVGVRLHAARREEENLLRDLNRRVEAARLAVHNAQKEVARLELEQASFKRPAALAVDKAKLQKTRHYHLSHMPGQIHIGCNAIPVWVAKKAVKLALQMRTRRK